MCAEHPSHLKTAPFPHHLHKLCFRKVCLLSWMSKLSWYRRFTFPVMLAVSKLIFSALFTWYFTTFPSKTRSSNTIRPGLLGAQAKPLPEDSSISHAQRAMHENARPSQWLWDWVKRTLFCKLPSFQPGSRWTNKDDSLLLRAVDQVYFWERLSGYSSPENRFTRLYSTWPKGERFPPEKKNRTKLTCCSPAKMLFVLSTNFTAKTHFWNSLDSPQNGLEFLTCSWGQPGSTCLASK